MVIIGVTPTLVEGEKEKITIGPDYMNAVKRAGAVPVLLPLTDDQAALNALLGRLDGLLLTGGDDIDPALYGEEKLPQCGDIAAARDKMELPLCRMALQQGLPMLCICRGIQVLNVALGGSLYQDIPSQVPEAIKHPRFDTPRDPVHPVTAAPGSLLEKITGQTSLSVNSRHHQAIKRLGDGLVCAATAPDGIMEAVELPGKKFVLGVQWHPESLSDRYPDAQALFNAFTEACQP